MSEWPPRLEELAETAPDSQRVLYRDKLRAELVNETSFFSRLSSQHQAALVRFLHHLDGCAAAAASRLDGRWTWHELQLGVPPVSSTPLRARDFKDYERQHQSWLCLQSCRAARGAIIEGAFIEALDVAFAAGEYAHSDFAGIGRKVLQFLPLRGKSASRPSYIKIDLQIAQDSRAFWAKRKIHPSKSQTALELIRLGKNHGLSFSRLRRKIPSE